MSHTFIPRPEPISAIVLSLVLMLAACRNGEHGNHPSRTAAQRDSAIDAAVRVPLDPASLAAEEALMPRFEAYPVADTFTGTPAPVDASSAEGARELAAVLREGARKGPNFAGHYTVVSWPDSTLGRMFAVVDARTGRVTMGPHLFFFGLGHRLDSSLLIMDPIDQWRREYGPDSKDPAGASAESHYYHWNGEKLVYINTLPLGSNTRASYAVQSVSHDH